MRTQLILLAGAVLSFGITGPVNAADETKTAEQIYEASCKICHDNGVAGAPKVGDQQWIARLAGKGMQGLVDSVKNGLNAMPPMGMCGDCSDQDFINVIQYMLPEDKPM